MSEKYKIHNPEGIYFVTQTIMYWIDVFTRPNQKGTITESLNYCITEKGLVVHAWCLMSNHLHLICKAENGNLSDILRDFKRHTSLKIIENINEEIESRKEWMLYAFGQAAKKIKRNHQYKVWQDGNHPVELDTNEMIDQRLEYVHNNPVKEMIVEKPENYLHSSARDYYGNNGLVHIEKIE